MNIDKSRNTEYQRCAVLLAQLIGLDADTEERICICFLSMGIKSFFLNLESLDLPQEIIEKLKNIKFIIEMTDGKGANIS